MAAAAASKRIAASGYREKIAAGIPAIKYAVVQQVLSSFLM